LTNTLNKGKRILTAQHRRCCSVSSYGAIASSISALNFFLKKNTRTRLSSEPMPLQNSKTVITNKRKKKKERKTECGTCNT